MTAPPTIATSNFLSSLIPLPMQAVRQLRRACGEKSPSRARCASRPEQIVHRKPAAPLWRDLRRGGRALFASPGAAAALEEPAGRSRPADRLGGTGEALP